MKGPLITLIYIALIAIGLVALLYSFVIGYGVHGSTFRLRWEHLPLALLIGFCFWFPIRNWILMARNKR